MEKSKELFETIVQTLEDKKAKEIRILEIKDISVLTDYFIVCTGTSTTHIKSLADAVDEKLSQAGREPFHIEGYKTARWILMDYGEVVVHIFHSDEREFYDLERLWADAKQILAGKNKDQA